MEFYLFYGDSNRLPSFLAEKATYLRGMEFCCICRDCVTSFGLIGNLGAERG